MGNKISQQEVVNHEKENGKNSMLKLLRVGLTSFAIILGFVILILSSFKYDFFSTWVVFIFMCGVPVQLVMTMQMENNYPLVVGRMPQPGKGILMTLFTIAVALVVAFLLFTFVGQSIGPPGPTLIMYTIMTVVVTFWFILGMNSWPLSRLTEHPLLLGVGSLIISYTLALVLFRLFFDFTFMSGEPVYVDSLDPKGLLTAWTAISFFVTTNAAILVLLLSEMSIISRFFKVSQQPILGLAATAFVLLVAFLCWGFFVKILAFDRAIYMVRVPVCFIFGVFLVDPLMQHQVFDKIKQPIRGFCLSGLAAVFAFLMYYVYAAVGPIITGVNLQSGPPAYDLELWIANALLGITFPIIVVVAKYFDFWPVKR